MADVEQPDLVGRRSPLYAALEAERYRRQALIRSIESATQRRLLVFFFAVNHPNSFISQVDVAPFQDLISDCEAGADVDLLIQSGGGDVDIAEKLIYSLRRRAHGLRAIVLERAKSAATLMALAADQIVMGDCSELGPIDPQVSLQGTGGGMVRPAHSFLDGLEQIKESVRNDGSLNAAYYPLLSQLDPALLDVCAKAIQRSEEFAEKWLSRHMLRDQPEQARQIAELLASGQQYIKSHGTAIDWEQARDMGLNVEHLPPDDALWQLLWDLYLAYEVAARNLGVSKIFESRKVSIRLE